MSPCLHPGDAREESGARRFGVPRRPLRSLQPLLALNCTPPVGILTVDGRSINLFWYILAGSRPLKQGMKGWELPGPLSSQGSACAWLSTRRASANHLRWTAHRFPPARLAASLGLLATGDVCFVRRRTPVVPSRCLSRDLKDLFMNSSTQSFIVIELWGWAVSIAPWLDRRRWLPSRRMKKSRFWRGISREV